MRENNVVDVLKENSNSEEVILKLYNSGDR